MHRIFTLKRKNLFIKACCACAALCMISISAISQVTVIGGATAAALAAKLTGTGVTVFGATLTCPSNAYGEFSVVSSSLGLDSGIVLTNGTAVTTASVNGVNITDGLKPARYPVNFASTDNSAPGDVDLTALSGHVTNDACVLEFNFKPDGDTIKFNYVFGSEEYTDYTCSPFNDVFGFFISGGAYATPTNIALIPGTSIPVCINAVNCGPTGGYLADSCNVITGPGSPYCMYYVNNDSSTTSFIMYDGLTTVLTAKAVVSPCDTYHLKLGVADATDFVYDSGVFIEAGSLSSTPIATITALGTSGLPYCIRSCAPGNFIFTLPKVHDTVTTVRFTVSGTAINGYDYAPIADSILIPTDSLSAILNIAPLPVPPAVPKVVTLEILVPDPCTGLVSIDAEASLTILDSFNFRIVTPDTSICNGQSVNIVAIGDSIFGSILSYAWSPASSISNDTSLTPIATPVVTTTYILTGSAAAVLGCTPETRDVTISVYNRPTLSIDSALVKTCVGVPVPLHVYALPATIPDTYVWSPTTDLSSAIISNPIVDPSVTGNVTYVVSVSPTAVPGCISTESITVHTVPNDFVLNNGDTAICIGSSVQVSITGSAEFSWLWTPPTGVSNVNIMQPLITPSATAVYTVTASYAHCPDMVHSFSIEVDFPAPTITITDTICLGNSDSVNLTVPGSGYYHYQWTPATFLTNDTIPNPVITPTVWGYYTWNVVIQPHAALCANLDVINVLVAPNAFAISPVDTAICFHNQVQVVATANPLLSYQWLPTAGIAMSTIVNPIIAPDTSAVYVVTGSFWKCPDIRDTLTIDVQPNPSLYIPGTQFVCQFDTIHVSASVSPAWYSHYIYSWSPSVNLDNDTSSTVVFKGDTSTLIVSVTTPAGCSAIDSTHIIVYPGNFAAINPVSKDFCPHDTATILLSGGDAYHWYPSIYISDSLGAAPVISPITSQSYSIIATSMYGCKDTLNFQATVNPGAVIFLGDSVTLYPGETYQIEPQTNCINFSWFPSSGLSNPKISDPLASPEISTKYIVHAATALGCVAVDSISIYVDPESLLAIPNAFTPGSGPNNEFKIILKGIASLNYFRIFNRWGNMVFETTDINKGWDGSFNGVPQPFGVYVYEVEATTSTGKIFEKHGNTTLIR